MVPSSQQAVDDFLAQSDSLRGLFTKLSGVLAGVEEPWLADATSRKTFTKEICQTRTLFRAIRPNKLLPASTMATFRWTSSSRHCIRLARRAGPGRA